ncbi:LAFA_0G16160g1_1 [Lachancea sp. 'fantastica']|nr:LAFA_0G16160g1_1 [Lachancea sp. 'fantastica']
MVSSGPHGIPEAVPLHREVARELQKWQTRDLSGLFNDIRGHFNQALIEAIDEGTVMDTSALQLGEVYKDFQALEQRQRKLASRVGETRARYVADCQGLPEVTWENWDAYREGALKAPQLHQVFAETFGRNPVASKDQTSVLFHALPYILRDPRSVVPDLTSPEDDDELHIAGGRIELTCPITFKTFEKPMVSRKCSHVYELEGSRQYLQNEPSRNCPVAGCGQKVSISDLVRDELMELRCRVSKVQETQEHQDKGLSVPTL